MENSGIKGFIAALAVHGVALALVCALGNSGRGNESVASDADPLLLLLPGNDDPTKDAGIIGAERGIARGTKDGKLFDPGKYTEGRLEKIAEDNRKAAEAEAARIAAEEAARERESEPQPANVENAKTARETPKKDATPAKNVPAKNDSGAKKNPSNAGKNSGRELVSTKDLIANKKNSGAKNGGKNSSSGKNSNGNGKGVSGGKINTGNILGNSSGTGGNGGDGGSRVADARQVYAAAVAKVFQVHFENVVAQNPVSLPQSKTVSVRFSVDARGNIRFLGIADSTDPQLTDRVKKAFERAFPSKFRTPPNGEAFTGRLDGITFVVN